MKIDKIDHVVLTVRNIEETCCFYSRVLGMRVVTFGEGRKALAFGRQKINLHQVGHEFEPKAAIPMPGSADLCFITGTPLETVVEHMSAQGIVIELGPIERTGATGSLESIYIRDLDGNLIEIANSKSVTCHGQK